MRDSKTIFSSLNFKKYVGLAMPLFALILLAASATSLYAADRSTVHKVPPVYPPLARQMHLSGTITVTATVDASGNVTKAETTSGNKLLAPAAIEAVKQWKFAPGEASTESVQINFAGN